MMSQVCSYDVISEGIPRNKQSSNRRELIHVEKECRQKWHCFTCMSGHCIRRESLLVLKLITVSEGISPPNDITGVSL